MVLSFFKKGESPLDRISHETVLMLGDARHSFDLASTALLAGADAAAVGADIRATDDRINSAEQRLRSELVVHIAVRGGDDIGLVMGCTLLLKKIERIGDQAKNILDLAEDGISLAGAPDIDEFMTRRQVISQMYVEASDILVSLDTAAAQAFLNRSMAMNRECEQKIHEYMRSEEPGHWAVPRAVLHRYWKRIVANLAGIVSSAIEPIQTLDYADGGSTDIVDD
ncbi:MAG: PhoU domain-containing protein [Actinobacteria bacterium]|nr:PhoU domain-containing protein [Actinomycetota bacterium]MDA2961334.1 PhoU domain-containing protein [Actinomycetota bacterium]